MPPGSVTEKSFVDSFPMRASEMRELVDSAVVVAAGVVVVEPDALTDEAATGWRTLYVVLTRATQRLTTVGTTDRWRQSLA